jgi:hypothetical protein
MAPRRTSISTCESPGQAAVRDRSRVMWRACRTPTAVVTSRAAAATAAVVSSQLHGRSATRSAPIPMASRRASPPMIPCARPSPRKSATRSAGGSVRVAIRATTAMVTRPPTQTDVARTRTDRRATSINPIAADCRLSSGGMACRCSSCVRLRRIGGDELGVDAHHSGPGGASWRVQGGVPAGERLGEEALVVRPERSQRLR